MSLVNEVSSKYLTGRIKRFGVQSLSDKELLYYLLNVKMQSKKASEACNAFFKDFSGLFQIKDFVPENWELLLGNDEQGFGAKENFQGDSEFGNRSSKRNFQRSFET